MSNTSTQKPIALVTGAASGIGLAIANRLSVDGYFVIGADRSDSIETSMSAINGRGIVVDMLDKAGLKELIDEINADQNRLDALVNCAGAVVFGERGFKNTESIDVDEWEMVLAVNLTAPFLLAKYAIPLLLKSDNGRIVNISSRAARTPIITSDPAYCASKTGLLGITRHMAKEYASQGITVNAITPGFVLTPSTSGMGEDHIARVAKDIPVGRVADPSEVAAMASYLCSAEASYVTGAVLDINGGAFIG